MKKIWFIKLHPKRLIRSPLFAKVYASCAVLALLATTALWSWLGADVHTSNADQLVDAYMLGDAETFRGALFPGQHSFLVKWPLFWLIQLFGFSRSTFMAFTIGIVLLTVGVLAALLYRIEQRPLLFGTLCLALASSLLLVPAEPYPGALLPVNMAMIATRNIEYVLYIAGLLLMVRSAKFKSKSFWLGVACMGLLISSDKLFLSLSVGGALMAGVVCIVARRWDYVRLMGRWLIGTISAAIVSTLVIRFVNASGLTTILTSSAAGPYQLVRTAGAFGLGVVYIFLSVLSNFGANPAADPTVIKEIPVQVRDGLLGWSGISYVLNGLILVCGFVAAGYVVRSSLVRRSAVKIQHDNWFRLSLVLIWATLAASVVFVMSDHYYSVDARYLAISLFAVFVTVAVYLRSTNWRADQVLPVGALLVVGICFGLPSAFRSHAESKSVLAAIDQRNVLVTQVLAHHPVETLLGDYWRVVPIRLASHDRVDVTPLANCTEPRNGLSSQAWQPDLRSTSFAYLLSLEKGLTDTPACSLQQAVDAYGHPNASVPITGSVEKPKELLLFYDKGISKNETAVTTGSDMAATVVPIPLASLPNVLCAGPTILNIVAHQDDDLLFMNPDLQRDIRAGHCVRTVYVTAGDAGADRFYWLSREQGSQAAYSRMLGSDAIWIRRIVKLSGGQFITVSSPSGHPNISLIFMHLPDGGVQGQGFGGSGYENLAQLLASTLPQLHSIDSQSAYTAAQLTTTLHHLMRLYRPAEVRTQSKDAGQQTHDHSDHMTVGAFAEQAFAQYGAESANNSDVPLKFYLGYPVREHAENVTGEDLLSKQAAFMAYAAFDNSVCHSVEQCSSDPAYGAYLSRQYQITQ